LRNAIITLLVAQLLLVLSVSLFAGEVSQAEPGSRLRVLVPDSTDDWIKGSLLSLDADTLMLKVRFPEGPDFRGDYRELEAPLAIPLSTISTLEMSRDRKSHTFLGAAIGLTVGVGIGVLSIRGTAENDLAAGDAALIGAGLFGIPGALIGAAIGSSIKTDRWETVPFDKLHNNVMQHKQDGFFFSMTLDRLF
jgi:hypothetical protein